MNTERSVTRGELLGHLVAHRIAGDVATSRASNLANIEKMLAREPEYWFGLELDRPWSFDDVLKVLVSRVGIDADGARTKGVDRIDPELCLDALDDAASVIARVARGRGRVMLGTGHPTGTLTLHLPIARALRAAGCDVLTAGDGDWVEVIGERRRIRYVEGVATVGTGGDLMHTHSPEPMQHVLTRLPVPPDLVIADHGWAGAAAQAGVPTVGFADTNDPALFVGAEEGKVAVAVPLDDNVLPAAYGPVATYLLSGVG
ncbi:MAG TPA: phosphatase [Mycobacteriales bacterium]|nr:phosphatase [Mycobacteriales bacterium]